LIGCLLASTIVTACQTRVVQAPEEPTTTPMSHTAAPVTPEPTASSDLLETMPDATDPTASAAASAVAPVSPPQPSNVTVHAVQPGDTLLGIASAYDVPMAAIQLQNQMGASTVVQVGQTLEIPSRDAWEGASRFWAVHVVATGETLSGIAQAYRLSVQAIQQVNDLTDADLIVLGQELVLPLDAPSIGQAPDPPATATTQPEPTTTPVPTPTVITGSVAPPPATPPAAPPPDDVSAWPRETVRLINVVREQHGLPPLIYNETLAQAAQGQANDCAHRGWCSHTGSDGSNIKTRILRTGYDPASWAECWAQRKTPQGAVDIWMDEVPPNDPHRRTLLTTWLSEIGVGIAKTDWGYYFIAVFGRPG